MALPAIPRAPATKKQSLIRIRPIPITASFPWAYHLETLAPQIGLLVRFLSIVLNHLFHHLFQACTRRPAQFSPGQGGITEQSFYLRRTEIARVDTHYYGTCVTSSTYFIKTLAIPNQRSPAQSAGRKFDKAAHRFGVLLLLEIFWLVCCSMRHCISIIASMSQSLRASRLPINKHSSSPSMRARPRVILRVTKVSPLRSDSWLKEQLQAHSVSLPVVHRNPVGVNFATP